MFFYSYYIGGGDGDSGGDDGDGDGDGGGVMYKPFVTEPIVLGASNA